MLVLVNTGIHRNSSDILTDQRKNTQRKVQKYNRMAEYVEEGLYHLKKKEYIEFGFDITNSMRIKQELAKNIINDKITQLVSRCAQKIIGYKICGAGGGGYLLFMTEDSQGLQSKFPELDTFRIRFDNQGSRIIFNNEK
jgi:D-glycero-alpha-D-manno-heptose-7-phosphate kinase